MDLSQSNCVENCHMRKEHLTTICQKLLDPSVEREEIIVEHVPMCHHDVR